MITFCTYFDSNYLDKGLMLYRSLKRNCKGFKLYIFCFDHKAFEVLDSYHLTNAVLIQWERFETEELLRLKKERTRAEYCWTCTPQIILHVLENYDDDHCIYIDADMAFFSDPVVLLDEIRTAKGHIGLMEHRFNKGFFGRRYLRRSGRFCVEFNYFDKTEESAKALRWWAQKCMEWCFQVYEPERMGDQKYLEKFPDLFHGVHIFSHPVAPWNSRQYKSYYEGNELKLQLKGQGLDTSLIFYHFQNIRYMTPRFLNIGSGTSRKDIKKNIYFPYLYGIEACRRALRNKGIDFQHGKVSSSNPLIAVWQRYFLRFKVKTVSDVVDMRSVVRYVRKAGRGRVLM